MITDKLQALGAATIRSVTGFGRAGIMLFGAILGKPDPRRGFGLLVKQLYVIGVMSLLIILVSGLFIGMVLALQGYYTLNKYGSEQALGLLVALSLTRELDHCFSSTMTRCGASSLS